MSYWGKRSPMDDYKNPEPPGEPDFFGSRHSTTVPPLFPSAFAASSRAGREEIADVIDDDCQVPEQLFPPGKVSDLQMRISKNPLQMFIGLEFLIEIQHNTIKKMPNSYSCLLCDYDIKVTKDRVNTLDLAINHLRSAQHRRAYLVKYFPTIEKLQLSGGGKANVNRLNEIVDTILTRFAPMKIKIVIGQKLFKRRAQEIKAIIENSTHFVEDDALIEELCGKQPKKTRLDQYADVFAELEKESKKPPSGGRKSPTSSGAEASFKSGSRRIDDLPLVGINPINEPPSSAEPGGVSPPRARGPEAPILIIEDTKTPRDGKVDKADVSSKRSDERQRDQGSRSRSRSRKRSSKRRSSSSNSSRSLSSDVDEAAKKANEELEGLVEEFLREEQRMLAFMDAERRKFLTVPESHWKYTEEWGFFYREKCRQERTSIHPSMLKNEWQDVWERFVAKEHRVKVEDEGIRLMRKYGIRNDDIRDYHIRKKRKQAKMEIESNSTSVINTLRLLSALEHLMDSLGQQVMVFFAQAKSLEAKGGDTKAFLERQDFVDFCHFSKEVLLRKLAVVPDEKQAKAVRTCIDNITVLLQQSSLKANAKSPESVVSVDKYPDPLQVQIAQTIVTLYKSNGKFITQDELDDLVKSEFSRIQEKQRPPPPQHHFEQPRQPQTFPTASLNNVNWDAIQNAVKLASSIPSTSSSVSAPQPQPDYEDDGYDDLSIEELTSLFRNFKHLDKDTQAHLIAYMQRLEKANPAKVVQLKTFMNSKKS